jgi:Putative transmembrane protein (Alph_Pro_TM)
MRRTSIIALLLAGLLILAVVPAGAAQTDLSLSLQPPKVEINAFFDGLRLKVEGKAPAGAQVGVLLSSPPKEIAFRIKSRLWGFLWMNREKVAFHGVPGVYMYRGSGVPPEEFHLGLKHLQARARIQDGRSNPAELFQEFINIKKGEGLYGLSSDGVTLGQAQNGLRPFACSFDLPARLPQGTYQVQAYVRDPQGRVITGPSHSLKAEEVGFPAMLSSVAYNYGLIYGILASLLALGAGLVTSMLFRGGGGAH